jgi:hypothetical protein
MELPIQSGSEIQIGSEIQNDAAANGLYSDRADDRDGDHLDHGVDRDSDVSEGSETSQDLVSDGYLRAVLIDPITGNDQWVPVMEDSLTSVDQTQPGIWDVHSASDQKSLEGTVYSQW